MSVDFRRTQPIMRWSCECGDPLCTPFRNCRCSRWPAPSDDEPDWWDPGDEGLCIWAAYQPKGAASLAASYLDLSGNGNNAGLGVAPTWDAVNGWKFNGIDQWLATTFVAQNDQSQTLIIQFTNLTNTGASYSRGGANIEFGLRPSNGAQHVYLNGASSTPAGAVASGNLCVAGNQGYRDGVADGLAIGVWGGANTITLPIGCRRTGAGTDTYCAFYVQAVAIYDCTLTAPQVLAVATAMAAL